MPKKIKIDLHDLKVQSFVTTLKEDQKEEVKGGLPYSCRSCDFECSYTYLWWCPPTDTFEPNCHTACACTNIQETYCPCL